MSRSSLQRRLSLVLMAVALASVALLGAGVWAAASVGARSDARDRLASQTAAFQDLTVGSVVLEARSELVVQRFARAFEVDDLGFVSVDDDGSTNVLAGLESLATLELSTEDVARLDAGETIFVDRPLRVIAVQAIEVTGPRRAQLDRTAVVITDNVVPLSPQVRRWFLLSAVGVLLLAAVVAAWLARRLSRPLQAIEETTEALAAGRLNARVHVDPEAGPNDEIARLGRSVNAMASDLERSRALEQQFLLSVSHDLRTPLTAIKGWAESLGDGTLSEPDEIRSAAAVIDRQAGRLDRLVRDLLDLARMGSRQFPLERVPVDLTQVADDSVEAHRPTAETDGVDLRLTGSEPRFVTGDADRLAQVFGNLVDNALRYAASEVLVSVGEDRDGVVVSIADDGPGIPADDLAHVFERLYVTQAAPRRSEQSSGLGLAIVRELVAAMDGRVDVVSPRPDVARGTVFTIRFPHAPSLPDLSEAGDARLPRSAPRDQRPA